MTRSLSGREVDCSAAPISCLRAFDSRCGLRPQTETRPPSGSRRPSRISTVVVLPAPFGPNRPPSVSLLNTLLGDSVFQREFFGWFPEVAFQVHARLDDCNAFAFEKLFL